MAKLTRYLFNLFLCVYLSLLVMGVYQILISSQYGDGLIFLVLYLLVKEGFLLCLFYIIFCLFFSKPIPFTILAVGIYFPIFILLVMLVDLVNFNLATLKFMFWSEWTFGFFNGRYGELSTSF